MSVLLSYRLRELRLPQLLIFLIVCVIGAWAVVNLSFKGIVGVFCFIALVALFIRNARIGFLAILFLKPIIDLAWDVRLFSFAGSNYNILRITGVMIPVLCLAYFMTMKSKFKINLVAGWIMLFLSLNMIAIFFNSVEAGDFMNIVLNDWLLKLLNGLMVFFALPYVFKDSNDGRTIIRTIYYSMFIPTLICLYLYVAGQYNVTKAQNVVRFAGIYHDAGGLSLNAFIGFAMSVFYLEIIKKETLWTLFVKRINYLLVFFMIGVNLWFVYLGITRIMYLTTLIFISMWFILYYKRYFTALLLIPAMIVWISNDEDFQQRNWKEIKAIEMYQKTGQIDKQDLKYSGGGRFLKWQDVINDMATEMELPNYVFGLGEGRGAHNEYLDIVFRTGFLGLLSFMAILFICFRKLLQNYKRGVSTNFFKSSASFFAFVLLICYAVMGGTGYIVSQTTFGIFMWSTVAVALYISDAPEENEIGTDNNN